VDVKFSILDPDLLGSKTILRIDNSDVSDPDLDWIQIRNDFEIINFTNTNYLYL
jgi:hypothetical protein